MKERLKMYVTGHIPQEALDVLLRDCNVGIWGSVDPVPRGELLNNVKGVDGLVCMESDTINSEVLDAAGPNLKVIGTMSYGIDHIDKRECQLRGIRIITLPHVSQETIADLTFASMLETTNRTVTGRDVVNGTTGNLSSEIKSNPCGRNGCICPEFLKKCTIGVLGFGRKGQAVATKFLDLGVANVLYNEINSTSPPQGLTVSCVTFESLLKESDIICICCKSSSISVHRLQKDAFNTMKNTAILIDCSNGEVIDYRDLYLALRDNIITAAGLNVLDMNKNFPYRDPLRGLQNCHFFTFRECNRAWDKRSKYSASFARDLVNLLKEMKATSY